MVEIHPQSEVGYDLTTRSPLRISQMVVPNHIQGAMASPSLWGADADALFRFKPVWKWYEPFG
jgi:hypothetical protein